MSKMDDISYCIENCPIGRDKSLELLEECNSACSAAIDFRFFVDECIKSCPYKDILSEPKTIFD